MKPVTKCNGDDVRRRFALIAMLCFLFGGYFILNYISMVSIAYQMSQIDDNVWGNYSRPNEINESFRRMGRPRELTLGHVFSPDRVIYLLAGIMFIIAGLTIGSLIRKKEMEFIGDYMTEMLLPPEEKTVMEELKEAGGSLTQKEITMKTGFNKVKVHRILNRLEKKKIIKRHDYGTTKKIFIEKKMMK